MPARKRHVLTATWRGYTARQDHVVHREVITRPEDFDGFHGIEFTDNTMLILDVRPCKPREKIKELDGYRELVAKAIRHRKPGQSIVRVADL